VSKRKVIVYCGKVSDFRRRIQKSKSFLSRWYRFNIQKILEREVI